MIFSGFYIYVLRRKKDTETKKKSEKDEESNKKGTGKKFIKGGKGWWRQVGWGMEEMWIVMGKGGQGNTEHTFMQRDSWLGAAAVGLQ